MDFWQHNIWELGIKIRLQMIRKLVNHLKSRYLIIKNFRASRGIKEVNLNSPRAARGVGRMLKFTVYLHIDLAGWAGSLNGITVSHALTDIHRKSIYNKNILFHTF